MKECLYCHRYFAPHECFGEVQLDTGRKTDHIICLDCAHVMVAQLASLHAKALRFKIEGVLEEKMERELWKWVEQTFNICNSLGEDYDPSDIGRG